MRQLTGKKNNIILYFFFLILLSTISNKALNKKENLFQIKNMDFIRVKIKIQKMNIFLLASKQSVKKVN